MISRRQMFMTGGALALTAAAGRSADAATLTLTDMQWRARLQPGPYQILRKAGTEIPFTSPLLKEHREGLFACVGCSQNLFSSKTKFESGTGWPSFWAPLPGAVKQKSDRSIGMDRTEVLCATCGGHLGHVFDDGPKPTGLRYCMNGLAMTFHTAKV